MEGVHDLSIQNFANISPHRSALNANIHKNIFQTTNVINHDIFKQVI